MARGRATETETATTRPSETGGRTDKETTGQATETGGRTDKETTGKATETGAPTDKETAVKASEKASGTELSTRPTKPSKVYTEQCGVEDDEDEWERNEGPQRIKTSQLTPERQVKYRAHLAKIFTKESLNGERVIFDPEDVAEVMREAYLYFKSEPCLIEDVPFGVTIVGDIHGQLHDLYRVFDCHAKDGKPGYECTKYLFMGDYVDRGRQSLEVLMALFCLKMLYPDDFFLLRGNHEFDSINMSEGFFFELLDRYEEETAKVVFWIINDTFNWMSMCAIVGNIYFCAHGGLSPRLFTRPQLRGLQKPIIENGEDVMVHDLCWSDPAVGLRGTAFNQKRGSSLYFGFDACVHALHSVGCVAMFRGHTIVPDGFDNLWFLCFTVFSATAQNKQDPNNAACVDVDLNGKLFVHILEVNLKRADRDHRLFGNKIKKRTEKEEEEDEEEDDDTMYDNTNFGIDNIEND